MGTTHTHILYTTLDCAYKFVVFRQVGMCIMMGGGGKEGDVRGKGTNIGGVDK